MIRSFIAVELPQETRDALAFVQERLRQGGARVRWLNPNSIHLTLKFLGNVATTQVDEIAAAAARELRDQQSLTLNVAGLGVFPNKRAPKIIWAGIQGEVERLSHVQGLLESALEKLGFPREQRAFRPHVTIGRIKDRRRSQGLLQVMTSVQLPECNSFDVDQIILYKSDLRPTGAIYTKLHRMPLSAPALP